MIAHRQKSPLSPSRSLPLIQSIQQDIEIRDFHRVEPIHEKTRQSANGAHNGRGAEPPRQRRSRWRRRRGHDSLIARRETDIMVMSYDIYEKSPPYFVGFDEQAVEMSWRC